MSRKIAPLLVLTFLCLLLTGCGDEESEVATQPANTSLGSIQTTVNDGVHGPITTGVGVNGEKMSVEDAKALIATSKEKTNCSVTEIA
jgi:hypothetical protein